MYCIEFWNVTFVAIKINWSLIQTRSVFTRTCASNHAWDLHALEINPWNYAALPRSFSSFRYCPFKRKFTKIGFNASPDSEPPQSRIERTQFNEEALPSSRVRDQVKGMLIIVLWWNDNMNMASNPPPPPTLTHPPWRHHCIPPTMCMFHNNKAYLIDWVYLDVPYTRV